MILRMREAKAKNQRKAAKAKKATCRRGAEKAEDAKSQSQKSRLNQRPGANAKKPPAGEEPGTQRMRKAKAEKTTKSRINLRKSHKSQKADKPSTLKNQKKLYFTRASHFILSTHGPPKKRPGIPREGPKDQRARNQIARGTRPQYRGSVESCLLIV